MKAFFPILFVSLVLGAPAFADENVSGGGNAAPAPADASAGDAGGASGANGQASVNWGSQGPANGDPQQKPANPPSLNEGEGLLPAFCPYLDHRCYKNSVGGDDSSCAAGAKGASPGQVACNSWGSGAPTTNAPTDTGTTTH